LPDHISPQETALRNAISRVREEGVESDREALLLWLVRNQLGLGAAESYENVFPEHSTTVGDLDGFAVSEERGVVALNYVLLRKSAEEMRLAAAALGAHLRSDADEDNLIYSQPRLRKLVGNALREAHGERVRRVVCVVDTTLQRPQKNKVRSAAPEGVVTEVFDHAFLASIAFAEGSSARPDTVTRISNPGEERLPLRLGDSRGLVLPVDATAIATWDGIEDGTLFDLNVRFGLGMNRVRRSLDVALTDEDVADQFIAFHNGITGVCDSFEEHDDEVIVRGMSIVNGAQTVVAVAANADHLAKGIQILLKIVEAASSSTLAQNIAIRSNTQNPVTSRSLQALDKTQVRLKKQLAEFGYQYVIRPGEDVPNPERAIENDTVAQLLCSMYLRKPSLAVKRQALFEQPTYEQLFHEGLDPAKVAFAFQTRRVVDTLRSEAPEIYRRAWALTGLTLFFMTSEALRSDPDWNDAFENPSRMVRDDAALRTRLLPVAEAALSVLEERADRDAEEPDDFKVSFKQARTLSDLGALASKAWRVRKRAGE
jgi:hypothetical protein